jgi:hypothetical protein
MNFTYTLRQPTNETWNEMVVLLANKKVDIGKKITKLKKTKIELFFT